MAVATQTTSQVAMSVAVTNAVIVPKTTPAKGVTAVKPIMTAATAPTGPWVMVRSCLSDATCMRAAHGAMIPARARPPSTSLGR